MTLGLIACDDSFLALEIKRNVDIVAGHGAEVLEGRRETEHDCSGQSDSAVGSVGRPNVECPTFNPLRQIPSDSKLSRVLQIGP